MRDSLLDFGTVSLTSTVAYGKTLDLGKDGTLTSCNPITIVVTAESEVTGFELSFGTCATEDGTYTVITKGSAIALSAGDMKRFNLPLEIKRFIKAGGKGTTGKVNISLEMGGLSD